ncbi:MULTISPECIES: YceI family protein [unclassified Novosphingobium]|uniref:YceI family protein n=1 Tax=unclassified Novosphingobium TaxID=2644732 RepID=UPI00086B86E9|nr:MULTISPECIES: YceI family protein [unclassified Novosphingobium]MBN9145740.1 YceI family protein [Novosphingobium sp.]MDR6706484.1 polyisoprenoid-binding protein YceI [Novosphingobium sp. 1748]NKI99158.1 polyisoprenoid-binding protein YceI [Novosphingobium sp. SG707]ODU82366.1 MAG: polyisoprenoid-binding protein [Novosphingobium sp. SCN 63-17]OJX97133.1 MAG: polyisoprenoid-binding protein [Novosphingobium sp. 63-713]
MFRSLIAAALIVAPVAAYAQSPVANPAPAAVQAGNYAVETTHTRVQFTVSHMGFSDWYGDLTGVTGSLVLDPKAPAAAKVDITIPVSSISTTNATLDGELKSEAWLDAGKYPEIRFTSTGVTPTGPRTANIAGNLTFHGVTRPVVLKAAFLASGVNPLSKGYTVGFNATAALKRSDFGVKTYIPLIGDEVTLRISAAFEKAK